MLSPWRKPSRIYNGRRPQKCKPLFREPRLMNFSANLVLVSGANGWLGRNLVETLINGDPNYKTIEKPQKGLIVRCLVLPGEDVSFLKSLSSQVEIVYGNLLRSDDCSAFVKNCQSATLFHTSGVIHPKRTNEFFAINVTGIKNLINESKVLVELKSVTKKFRSHLLN